MLWVGKKIFVRDLLLQINEKASWSEAFDFINFTHPLSFF
jgi:hypothetical protein